MIVTCAGCGLKGEAPADKVPLHKWAICPDCEPDTAAILACVTDHPIAYVGSGDVDDGRGDQ